MRVAGIGSDVMVKTEQCDTHMEVVSGSPPRHPSYGPAVCSPAGYARMRPYSPHDRPFAVPMVGRTPNLVGQTADKPAGMEFGSRSPPAQTMAEMSSGESDVATQKRELRLLKNREAAKECRRKKKEYVHCLENRVAVLEAQNRTLIEELKQLKDLYCTHGD